MQYETSTPSLRVFASGCYLSVCIRVHPWPKNQPLKTDRTPKKTSDLATDGHGYTRMRSASFLALHREKIGTKLYGYVLAKRYTSHSKHSRPDYENPSDQIRILWMGRRASLPARPHVALRPQRSDSLSPQLRGNASRARSGSPTQIPTDCGTCAPQGGRSLP